MHHPHPDHDPDLRPIVVDLLQLASLCHALGDVEKRDVALDLAADLLSGKLVTSC